MLLISVVLQFLPYNNITLKLSKCPSTPLRRDPIYHPSEVLNWRKSTAIVAAAGISEPLIYCMASIADGTSTSIYAPLIRGSLAFPRQYISIPQDLTATDVSFASTDNTDCLSGLRFKSKSGNSTQFGPFLSGDSGASAG